MKSSKTLLWFRYAALVRGLERFCESDEIRQPEEGYEIEQSDENSYPYFQTIVTKFHPTNMEHSGSSRGPPSFELLFHDRNNKLRIESFVAAVSAARSWHCLVQIAQDTNGLLELHTKSIFRTHFLKQ